MHKRVDNSYKRRAGYQFVAPSSLSAQSVVSDRHLYTGEVCTPCAGYRNRADLKFPPEFPEILGELSMRKQCVPSALFSAHAQEPGNEAREGVTFSMFKHIL